MWIVFESHNERAKKPTTRTKRRSKKANLWRTADECKQRHPQRIAPRDNILVQKVCRLVFVWKFVFKKYIGLMEEDFLNTFTGDGNVTTKDSWFRTLSTEDLG